MKWADYKKGYLELLSDEGIDYSEETIEEKLDKLKKLWKNGFSLMDAFERLEDF